MALAIVVLVVGAVTVVCSQCVTDRQLAGGTYHKKTALERQPMSLSDTQILAALVVALIPGVLAFRLSTELYK